MTIQDGDGELLDAECGCQIYVEGDALYLKLCSPNCGERAYAENRAATEGLTLRVLEV